MNWAKVLIMCAYVVFFRESLEIKGLLDLLVSKELRYGGNKYPIRDFLFSLSPFNFCEMLVFAYRKHCFSVDSFCFENFKLPFYTSSYGMGFGIILQYSEFINWFMSVVSMEHLKNLSLESHSYVVGFIFTLCVHFTFVTQ